MRKWMAMLLAALMILGAYCGMAESAVTDPIKVSMSLSNNRFTESEEITVTITVTNTSDKKIPGALTLYDPSGKKIESFGSPQLEAGEVKTWTGKWIVTQAQLEAGRITFKVKYSIHNEKGELINKTKNFSKAIAANNPDVIVTCCASQETAAIGESFTVTWRVENTGDKEVQVFTARERTQYGEMGEFAEETGEIKSIAAGDTAEYIFTHVMREEYIVIRPNYFFKIGDRTYNGTLPAITVVCISEDAKEKQSAPPSPSSAPANIILIVDGEVYPLTEEQKLQISEIIQ